MTMVAPLSKDETSRGYMTALFQICTPFYQIAFNNLAFKMFELLPFLNQFGGGPIMMTSSVGGVGTDEK